jgi:hypothetical protein
MLTGIVLLGTLTLIIMQYRSKAASRLSVSEAS